MMECVYHSTGGRPVEPGQEVTMVATPLRSILPIRAVFTSHSDAAWRIRRLSVGVKELILGSHARDPRSLESGSLVMVSGPPVPLFGGHLVCESTELAQWFKLEQIPADALFWMDIINVGPVASPFRAMWHCDVIDDAIDLSASHPPIAPPGYTPGCTCAECVSRAARACAETWKGPDRVTCMHGHNWMCQHGEAAGFRAKETPTSYSQLEGTAMVPEAGLPRNPTPSEADAIVEQMKANAAPQKPQRIAFRPERAKDWIVKDIQIVTNRPPDITKRPPNVPFRPNVYITANGEHHAVSMGVGDEHYTPIAPISKIDRVPGVAGRPQRVTRPPAGFGWDPEGNG